MPVKAEHLWQVGLGDRRGPDYETLVLRVSNISPAGLIEPPLAGLPDGWMATPPTWWHATLATDGRWAAPDVTRVPSRKAILRADRIVTTAHSIRLVLSPSTLIESVLSQFAVSRAEPLYVTLAYWLGDDANTRKNVMAINATPASVEAVAVEHRVSGGTREPFGYQVLRSWAVSPPAARSGV